MESEAVRIPNITLTLDEEENILPEKAAGALGVPPDRIQDLRILRKSLDARRKNRIQFVYTLECSLAPAEEKKEISTPSSAGPVQTPPRAARVFRKQGSRPVVVGTGPAGLFAALQLAEMGAPPLIIERGKEVPERIKDVEKFWREGVLDAESNVQFGEGGAGTFSDGKLFTRLHEPRIASILDTFARFGAPAEIRFLQRPHIGTDRLRSIIPAIRGHLQGKGAEFRFQTRLTGLAAEDGELRAIVVNGRERIESPALFLAPGNSARDTFTMLHAQGAALEAKPFAVGVRVEHPQKLIDRIQYGSSAGHPKLPAAEYFLTFRSSRGHAVYSFCMCPGGFVIGAASEPGALALNGMSYYRRNSRWANSAVVVGVGNDELPAERGALAGIEFQRRWERKAFASGGGNFQAPAQGLIDFVEHRPPGKVGETSFRPGVAAAALDECLPEFVVESLREALPFFNRKMAGFCSRETVLIGVETRTSSPVRILRNEKYESVSIRGLYPIGEGSGYAGGIMSSALDGIKAVEAYLKQGVGSRG